MRALVVEDDELTRTFVARGLKEAGLLVECAAEGQDAFRKAVIEPFDVAVVDIMLPGMDGLELIRAWRRRGVTMPILILSAKRSVDDRVRGLETGSDDYLVKPFAITELVARVRALVRRATGESEPNRLRVRDLEMDLLRRRVTRAGVRIDLTPREFALLEFLLRNAGRVVSRTAIMEHVWGYNFDPGTNVVDVMVSRLRDKIDKPFDTRLIHTVRGAGYVIE